MPNTSKIIADALRHNRAALGIALTESLAGWDKYSEGLADPSNRREFAQRETVVFVDYLAAYFGHGDPTYRDLYLGEKLKQCYDPHDDLDAAIARRWHITNLDNKLFVEIA